MTTNSNVLKMQIQAKKNNLLIYIIFGTILLFMTTLFISDEPEPSFFLFMGAIVIALIFYIQSASLVTKPSFEVVKSLTTIMYLFIGIFILAIIVNVMWWEALYFSTVLGAVLAVAGYYLMNQIIAEGKMIISGATQQSNIPREGVPSPKAQQRPKFCPSCGESLETLTSSNFCPNCGQQV